ncbi:unnamed protein product, partial [Mesorhabditis belari]|uniref:Tetratricopeptide repeat protein 5 OB fold domain-containing protein n=1 Tax=Mesorhabditis belari TaxID=2138241 RepID=A0AAF3J9V0_9BILA
MEGVDAKIEEIETFCDQYFENFPTKSDEDRCVDVKSRVQELLQSLNQKDKGNFDVSLLLLKGRISNLCIDYSGECEELLAQYVKLKPSDPRGWTELGNCLLKKPDVEYALECLECGYEFCKSAELLSLLATVIRFTLGTITDKKLAAQARAALLSLANARFGSFFHLEKNHFETLENATDAYQKALKNRRTGYDPALHLNLATAYRYLDKYAEAIIHLKRAHVLEPFSPIAMDRLKSLNKIILSISKGITKHSKISIFETSKRIDVNKTKESLLLDFGAPLSHESIGLLKPGTNDGLYTVGRIVTNVASSEDVPRVFLVIDESGFCAAISIYNCSNHFQLSIGDELTIANPLLNVIENVEVEMDEKQVLNASFHSIRVASPLYILRNGQKVKSTEIAIATVAFTNHAET